MSVGIFDSGFSSISAACGLVKATTLRTQEMRSVRPNSWATIITLRTKGERGDQCSFMQCPVIGRAVPARLAWLTNSLKRAKMRPVKGRLERARPAGPFFGRAGETPALRYGHDG